MELSDFVSYEREFELPIVHPADFQRGVENPRPVGFTFWIKHLDCEAAVSLMDSARSSDAATGGDPNVKAPGKDSRDMYAACISRWDWGEGEWDGERPDCTLENAIKIMRDPRAAWILRQVMVGAQNVGNFTKD